MVTVGGEEWTCGRARGETPIEFVARHLYIDSITRVENTNADVDAIQLFDIFSRLNCHTFRPFFFFRSNKLLNQAFSRTLFHWRTTSDRERGGSAPRREENRFDG